MRLLADADPSSLAFPVSPPAGGEGGRARRILSAATALLAFLERGEAPRARTLRGAMTEAFGATDSEGAWIWKDAYEACEAAQLLFLRRHLNAMRAHAGSNARLLDLLGRLAALTPTHTRRSEESHQLQQFSTPVALGFIASLAAGITADDLVLEPSAGTGQLAIFAALQGASLALNEIAGTRADLLSLLFPGAPLTRFNAAQIHDYLPEGLIPSVILMNPPFSAAPNVKGGMAGTDLRHLRSALLRLAPGGRLVAITGAELFPSHPEFRDGLQDLEVRVVFTAAIAGALYRRHGTTVETRLTVIDRVPSSEWCAQLPCPPMAESAQELLDLVATHVPPRLIPDPPPRPVAAFPLSARTQPSLFPPAPPALAVAEARYAPGLSRTGPRAHLYYR